METQNKLTVPIAIVAAGTLIALAIFIKGAPAQKQEAAVIEDKKAEIVLDPISEADHILGNPEALVKIIEYSDLECPFCKDFHPVMKKAMEEYGKSGKVAWVYRHFPILSIHPKALKESVASECAAELGGNEKFWEYIDRIFQVTPANNGLDERKLPQIAAELKLDVSLFNSCLNSNKYTEKVNSQLQSGIKAGVSGTPTSFLVSSKGSQKIPGYLPYADLKIYIDSALAE